MLTLIQMLRRRSRRRRHLIKLRVTTPSTVVTANVSYSLGQEVVIAVDDDRDFLKNGSIRSRGTSSRSTGVGASARGRGAASGAPKSVTVHRCRGDSIEPFHRVLQFVAKPPPLVAASFPWDNGVGIQTEKEEDEAKAAESVTPTPLIQNIGGPSISIAAAVILLKEDEGTCPVEMEVSGGGDGAWPVELEGDAATGTWSSEEVQVKVV